MTTFLRLSCCVVAIAALGCAQQGAPVVEYVEISPAEPRLGEVATLRFVAKDYRGEPLAGTAIGFRLKTDDGSGKLPGVTLEPASATTLKGSGFAETQLIVTSRVSSVVVIASSPPCGDVGTEQLPKCGNDNLQVETPPITVAGATVPNHKQFTFQCGVLAGNASGGVHALGPYDYSRNMIAGLKVKCYAHTGDRNGDGVSGALVSFLTEAGTIGPTETTATDVIGNAEILYKTSLPMPRETDPVNWAWTPATGATQTGEYVAPLWMHPYVWTSRPVISFGQAPNLQEPRRRDPVRKTTSGGNITNNVRDNLVSLIAVTSGEEAFTDVNNNGAYDNGEPFEDLTEPFVDTNDDGTWQSEERYIDSNGNGTWDGKNGKWDGSGFIWVQERILWTGMVNPADAADTVDPIFRLIDPPPGTTPTLEVWDTLPVTIQLCDPWLNSIAQNGDDDSCELAGSDDKSPVTAFPKKNLGGKAFTYPSCPTASFWIIDSRDPALPLCGLPGCNPVRRDPPVEWVAPICCKYTSSPIDGFITKVCVATIQGLIH